MTYTYFSFFFIPLFKWNKEYYALSSCCHTVFSIEKAFGMAISKGEKITLKEDDLLILSTTERRSYYCEDCGYMLTEDFTYCPKCGKKQ